MKRSPTWSPAVFGWHYRMQRVDNRMSIAREFVKQGRSPLTLRISWMGIGPFGNWTISLRANAGTIAFASGSDGTKVASEFERKIAEAVSSIDLFMKGGES